MANTSQGSTRASTALRQPTYRCKHSALWICLSVLVASRALQTHGAKSMSRTMSHQSSHEKGSMMSAVNSQTKLRQSSRQKSEVSVNGDLRKTTTKEQLKPIARSASESLTERNIPLQSLRSMSRSSTEECEFQFNAAEGELPLRLTVQPEDGLHCDKLTPQQLFDGFEYLYSDLFGFFTARLLAKPNFYPTQLDSDSFTTTDQPRIISIVQSLSEGLWKKVETGSNGETGSNRVTMQLVNIGTSVEHRHKNTMTIRVYNADLDEAGVQLEVKMPVMKPGEEYSIFVFFGKNLSLQDVFDNLSRGENMDLKGCTGSTGVYVKGRAPFGLVRVLPSSFWTVIRKSIENAAPIKKYEATDTIVINARSPQDPLRAQIPKLVHKTATMKDYYGKLQGPAVKNLLWFDSRSFKIKEDELEPITKRKCRELTRYTGVRVEIKLLVGASKKAFESKGMTLVERKRSSRNQQTPITVFSIIVLFSDEYSLQQVFDVVSGGEKVLPRLMFVLLGDQIVRYAAGWPNFSKRIENTPPVGKDEIRDRIQIRFWSRMDRYIIDEYPEDKLSIPHNDFAVQCNLLEETVKKSPKSKKADSIWDFNILQTLMQLYNPTPH